MSTNAKHISKQTPGTVSSSSARRSSPSQLFRRPRARSHSSRRQLRSFRALSRSLSPSH